MSTIIACLILVVILAYSVSLRKINRVPLVERRRQARSGNLKDQRLYTIASYQHGLKILSWLLTGLSGGTLFVIISRHFNLWVAILAVLFIIWLVFAWLPTSGFSRLSKSLTTLMAPILIRLLSWLQPLSSRVELKLKKWSSLQVHSGLYEKDDLIDLLHHQASQSDNRIPKEDLNIATGAIRFGDIPVRTIMTPLRVIKTVKATDTVGPYLMDRLHKSGFSRFPVIDSVDGQKNYVGTLYLKDLLRYKEGATVSKAMQPEVYYVNDEHNLRQVLQAAAKTKHHLFMVVNSFEEVVGIITLEDVLEQILGQKIVDEFDQYDDLRAVAAVQAEKQHKEHQAFHSSMPEVRQSEKAKS